MIHSQEKLSPLEKIQRVFWKALYPYFPTLQGALVRSHIIRHESGRQRYHLGWLAPHVSLEKLKDHLSREWNFGNHFVAWKDTDQVLSWRRLASFEEQWHLRVYADGEIRGHYERTPEASPLKHFEEVGETARAAEFKKFLGAYCVAHPTFRHLQPDSTMIHPVSEMTT